MKRKFDAASNLLGLKKILSKSAIFHEWAWSYEFRTGTAYVGGLFFSASIKASFFVFPFSFKAIISAASYTLVLKTTNFMRAKDQTGTPK